MYEIQRICMHCLKKNYNWDCGMEIYKIYVCTGFATKISSLSPKQ